MLRRLLGAIIGHAMELAPLERGHIPPSGDVQQRLGAAHPISRIVQHNALHRVPN
jgi:hypothetical protein